MDSLFFPCLRKQNKPITCTIRVLFLYEQTGSAHWEARYLFSKTGRSVYNKIEAQFEFKDGKIIKHTDDFDLHKWASQAMGWKGKILGGTGFFNKKLQQQTHHMLHKFMTS